MAVLLEDVVVSWLHADDTRIAKIRASPNKALFELDRNGPQCADAVSWLRKWLPGICVHKNNFRR